MGNMTNEKIIKFIVAAGIFIALLTLALNVAAAASKSNNDTNKTNGWAHTNQLTKEVSKTEMEFVSTRKFLSCFEYRTDGDTTQRIGENNYNTQITDGLYPFKCINNSTTTVELEADEYVEVRMVFGAESDERFDWTRFDVIEKPVVITPTPSMSTTGTVPRLPKSSTLAPSVCTNTTVGSVAGIYVDSGTPNDNTVVVRFWQPTGADKVHVIYTELNSDTWSHALLNAPNNGALEIGHLKNGGTYAFAVAGVNGCMVGDWSTVYKQTP